MSVQRTLDCATSGSETTTGGDGNMEIKIENKTAAFCGKLWQAAGRSGQGQVAACEWGNHMHATTAAAAGRN